jgi:cephalosporin hydroxylase
MPHRRRARLRMRITIDTETRTMDLDAGGEAKKLPLYSRQAQALLARLFLKVDWSNQRWRSHSWLGLQVLQLPEDLLRLQEVIVAIRPDVIVETGVFNGGSTVFHASLCRLLGHGRVIGIDINVPREVREAVKNHVVGAHVTLIQGSSTDPMVLDRVYALIRPQDKVMVILDSDHSYAHVTAELEAYAPLVSVGSYLLATDGVMQDLADTPLGKPDWRDDNPARAARDFIARRKDFIAERPRALYCNEFVLEELTYYADGWLKRVR